MIYLKRGQLLFDNPGMVVCDRTGYYNDGDSVLCAPAYNPEEPACRYEAQYVAYGGLVYSVSDQEKLMEEIKRIDPENLFGKNKEEVAIDEKIENIETVKSENPTEASEIPEEPATEVVPEEEVQEEVVQEEPTEEVVPEEIITREQVPPEIIPEEVVPLEVPPPANPIIQEEIPASVPPTQEEIISYAKKKSLKKSGIRV